MARRLSAVLAADVAGCSRLMEVDERVTLRHLKACESQVFEPIEE